MQEILTSYNEISFSAAISEALKWIHKIIEMPVVKAYIFSIVMVFVLRLFRMIFRKVFMKLKVDDRYVREKILQAKSVRLEPLNGFTRQDYGYQQYVFHSVPMGICYSVIWFIFIISLISVHVMGGYMIVPFILYIISRFGEYVQPLQ